MTRTTKPQPSNMTAPGLGGGLLNHLPQYGVIICRDCKFAIQPNALSSHLQNHHILRSERRRILDQLASITLISADQVPVPPSDAAPIDDLPILSGSKCNSPNCNYACTSSKRMSQHWSEIHQQPNSKLVDQRDAKLQTFFRGNKIRYFEVLGPPNSPCWSQKQSQSARDTVMGASPSLSVRSTTPGMSDMTMSPADEAVNPPKLDMQSLEYMCHYMTASGYCLDRGTESPLFWTNSISNEAHQHEFLMYGMLATAALHKAVASRTNEERERHQRAAAAYQVGSLPGFRAAVAKPTTENSIAIIACSRMLGVQDSVLDMMELAHSTRAFSAADIVELVVLLRGCSDLMLSVQPLLPLDSDLRLTPEIEQGLRQFDNNRFLESPVAGERVPPALRAALTGLETVLVQTDLLPAEQLPRLRPAIKTLAACVSHSYDANPEAGIEWPMWNGLEGFLRSSAMRDGLIPAIEAHEPAALVVFALWGILLLRRIERNHWFVQGLSEHAIKMAVHVANNAAVEKVIRNFCELSNGAMPSS